MSFAGDGQEKTEEATPRKRQEARRKGTVAKSTDLTGSLVLLAVCLALPSAVGSISAAALAAVRSGITNTPTQLDFGSLARYSMAVIMPLTAGLAILLGVAMVAGIVANLGQVGFHASPETLNPSFDKINPLNGLKRMFSARSAVEGLKTIAKSLLFGWLAYASVATDWSKTIGLGWLTPMEAARQVGQSMHTLTLRMAIVWLMLAALDYLFQRQQIEKQLRMSRDELKREMKEQEGSPEVKMAQAQRRRKLSKGRLSQSIKEADVVITNPTHYAVAVQYDRSKMHAPMVVAKGQDYLAARIRELAVEHNVPIVPNPPLARALYKQCEVGDFVPREVFQAVAEVLAYVYRTLSRVRTGAR